MEEIRKDAEELVLLGQAGWPRAAILEQVERFRNSSAFDDGEQARALLGYLVDEALAGRVPSAPAVARVIGKLDYRSTDPHVRKAMARLRERLEKYNARKRKGEIPLEIPEGNYIVFAPRKTAASSNIVGPPIAAIIEPAEQEEVYGTVPVRGRIDELDPDLRPWLVVLASDGFYYPQSRVSRRSPSWESEVRCGRMEWGKTDGSEFVILLVAAAEDGDFKFQGDKEGRDLGFGTRLPTDVIVLDTRRVIRRDIRPGSPTTWPPNGELA